MALPDNIKKELEVKPTALISKDIVEGGADIALIPSFDLITRRDLFVSKKYAISFDGELSNSYVYFKNNGEAFTNFLLRGDVSSNEVLLSRIVFSEKYDSKIVTNLDSQNLQLGDKDYIICGNENFIPDVFGKGISFAEEIADMIDYPYVNYVFASSKKEKIEEFNELLSEPDKKIESQLPELLDKITTKEKIKDFIIENFSTVYFDLTQNEIEGLKELLHLPFIHGLMDEMFEINLV